MEDNDLLAVAVLAVLLGLGLPRPAGVHLLLGQNGGRWGGELLLILHTFDAHF